MYIILGWVGWIWLAIVMVVLPLALWIQHVRRRRQLDQQHDGASGVEVNGKNEKQS
jgi:heme exporter protein D